MSIADLSNILSIFGGSEADPEQQQALFKEALLMTLARASSSDANIHDDEIESIKAIVARETGDQLSDQDVRKAARTELYESTPMRKYLAGIRKQLRDEDRVKIIQLLAEVVRSDTSISVLEIDYFNAIAESLNVTPAELAGLKAAD